MDYTVYDLILADENGNLFSYTGDCSWIADQNFDNDEVKEIKDSNNYPFGKKNDRSNYYYTQDVYSGGQGITGRMKKRKKKNVRIRKIKKTT